VWLNHELRITGRDPPPGLTSCVGTESLGTLQRQLLDEAKGQELADAMQNAAAFRKTAELVGQAAERIQSGLEES